MHLPTLDAVHSQFRAFAAQNPADGLPAFLFRGERGPYPNTYSHIDRHYHDLPPFEDSGESAERAREVYEELDALTAFCMRHALPEHGLSAKLAGAFAQHYGLPTQVFDFTASLEVAINFAANRAGSAAPPQVVGQIGVLDVATALASGRVELFDLRKFEQAPRAQKQSAFGLIYSAFLADDEVDLKVPELASAIGLSWTRFAHLPDDETYLWVTGNDADLMRVVDSTGAADPWADIPLQMIDAFVSARRRPLLRETRKILGRTLDLDSCPASEPCD